RIPRPISGENPVTGITGTQYTGTVSWTPAPPSTFQYGTVYTAVLTLQAAPGYTFAGIGQNAFSHEDAPGAVTNPAGGATVRITFPPAASATYSVITSFGPVERESSALALMRAKKADNGLTIDLPGDTEPVDPNSVILVAGDNSPAKVIINGHGQELTIGGQGTLLTVGSGVTLTLRNITLSGIQGNDAPLIMVRRGGKLVLGDGVILTDNETTADAGGVWVNGGELVLNPGAEITGMAAQRGGGVLVDTYGTLFMNGGIIAGNTASGVNGGGGVLLLSGGTFTMVDGTIQSNRVLEESSGGGVLVIGGPYDMSFNMFGGTIQYNRAEDKNSGGGVLVIGVLDIDGKYNMSFNMFGGTIQYNRAMAGSSGGGVGILVDWGIFNLYDGAIRGNNALGAESGGGVFINASYYGGFYFYMYGGTIGGEGGEANTASSGGGNGVCVLDGAFIMSGGTITGNGSGGYGVLCRSDNSYGYSGFTMSGPARIDEDVFLTCEYYPPLVIIIGGDLSAPSPVANIIVDPPPVSGTPFGTPFGTPLMKASSSELIQRNYQKFQFNGSTLSDIDIDYDGWRYCGYYK
ncbi:MAG: hypothetical protein LBC60_01040, partial [Spirochaetaceae bacterium]|nr:hypothetical protein [Spirochaetaceae bacterium]